MLKNKSQFEIKNLILPVIGATITSATIGGIYFGANSLRSIDNDPNHIKTDYKYPIKAVDSLRQPKVEARKFAPKPKSKLQATNQLSQLKKQGLVIKSESKPNSLKIKDSKTGIVIFSNTIESSSSSLTKCLNTLRRRNRDMVFQNSFIQSTKGYDRICTGNGIVVGTNKNIQAQEILPYVKGELKALDQKYSSLKGKQVKVDNYKNGSIYYTRYPSINYSQKTTEINQLIQTSNPIKLSPKASVK